MPHHSWHPNQTLPWHKGPRIILLSQMGECHKTSQVKTSGEDALLEMGKSLSSLLTDTHMGSQWQSQHYLGVFQFPAGVVLDDPTPSCSWLGISARERQKGKRHSK